jgi:Bacterial Ig domain
VRPLVAASQQACPPDGATGLVDCGHWSVSASWGVPADAVSGIYFAHLVREDGVSGESHIPFVVRDDEGGSDLLFQTSDTTWQAYNRYGGNSLYVGGPGTGPGRAYKVSYNRPFTTREYAAEDWVFNAEYPMVRWLERNGYDVSYFSGVDTDRYGAELREHRAFLSVGHDEYWSGQQRANVEAARDAGVDLAFLSGNEVFWKTRWENGHRTLVSYKETHANGKIDPSGAWTGTWRDPRPFNPEGGRPENALTGTSFSVNSGTVALEVPAAEGQLRLWRNTGLGGGPATLADGAVGYEWDEDVDNGARPAGLIQLSSTTASGVEKLLDYGSTYGSGTATHSLTLHRDFNGAGPDGLVFGAGTVQWSWGLDGEHDRGGSTPSGAMQQATVNLFADMLVQPATLQAGLTPAGASTDCVAPSSAPHARAVAVSAGTPATVTGTAADGGGRVGGVEVSVDGGSSWHPAAGRESWSYTWTPAASGQVSVLSRATDDSGVLEGATGCDLAGGGGTAPGATRGQKRKKGPRVRVRPRRVRMSARGRVKLRVTCPKGERACRVKLRLRRRAKTLAHKKLKVAGGKTRRVKLRLKRSARRRVRRAGSLRVVAVAAARDAAGNSATTRTRIRILRPRRR